MKHLVTGTSLSAIDETKGKYQMLDVLERFTVLSGWKLWEHEVKSQLLVVEFIYNEVLKHPKKVTIEMFEAAIVWGVKHKQGYERAPLTLLQMLEDWLNEFNDELFDARREIIQPVASLPARTESQIKQDTLDLVDSIRQSVLRGESILGGWDFVLQHFTDIGVHEKGSDISVKIWNESIAKVKANLVNQQKTGQIHERSAANLILQNWEEQRKSMDVVIQAASIYTESICRYYFKEGR